MSKEIVSACLAGSDFRLKETSFFIKLSPTLPDNRHGLRTGWDRTPAGLKDAGGGGPSPCFQPCTRSSKPKRTETEREGRKTQGSSDHILRITDVCECTVEVRNSM